MPILLLSIPGAFLVLIGLLMLSATVEAQVLSPRSLITAAVRSRRAAPEVAEALVAREFERLLRDTQRR